MAYVWIWDTLSSRGYWSGMVKDFCKRGDHNWVEANVYPRVDADSHICNYHSTHRNRPGRRSPRLRRCMCMQNRRGEEQRD